MKALVKAEAKPGLTLQDVSKTDVGIKDVLVRVKRTAIGPRHHLWHRFEAVIQGGFGSRRSDEETKMRARSSKPKVSAARVVKDIRRATQRHFSAEDKIRIVLESLRGDDSIAELCRKEGPKIIGLTACITPRQRSSWRLANEGSLAIRPVPRAPTRARVWAASRVI